MLKEAFTLVPTVSVGIQCNVRRSASFYLQGITLTRSRHKIFEDGHPYFVTGTIVKWFPLFTNPELVQIVLDSLAFLQNHNR
jgi:hypothetical protein